MQSSDKHRGLLITASLEGFTLVQTFFLRQTLTSLLRGRQPWLYLLYKLSYTDIGRHIYKPLNVLINMRRKYERYSEEFKLSVVRDYYSCGMSKYACVKKYNLSSGRVLNLWLLAYDKAENPLSLPSEPLEEDMPNRNKDSYKDENQELKKRIRELEKALEFSRLETKVRDMMIDKAEEYFNIPIRKKSGAK